MRLENRLRGQKLTFIEEARRAQIVACAIDSIAEVGYLKASLAQIAARAGISKAAVLYHFAGKGELVQQIVYDLYAAGAEFMGPRILAETTSRGMLRAYIVSNLELMRSRRNHLAAVIEIVSNLRAADGRLRFDAAANEGVVAPLEELLRQGQAVGEFRDFSPRVMALAIRAAIDAVPAQLLADPTLDLDHYAAELAALFDLATRKVSGPGDPAD